MAREAIRNVGETGRPEELWPAFNRAADDLLAKRGTFSSYGSGLNGMSWWIDRQHTPEELEGWRP